MVKKKISKETPKGVKIITMIYFLTGAIFIFLALYRFSGAMTYYLPNMPWDSYDLSSFVMESFWAIFLLGFSIFLFILGINIYRGKSWAKLTANIISTILFFFLLFKFFIELFLESIRGLPRFNNLNIAVILMNGYSALYLFFSKKVKQFFPEE